MRSVLHQSKSKHCTARGLPPLPRCRRRHRRQQSLPTAWLLRPIAARRRRQRLSPPPAAPLVAAATSLRLAPVAPAAAAAPDNNAEILAVVNKWAKDWASRNPDGYLAAYPEFQTGGRQHAAAWSAPARTHHHPRKIKRLSVWHHRRGVSQTSAGDFPPGPTPCRPARARR